MESIFQKSDGLGGIFRDEEEIGEAIVRKDASLRWFVEGREEKREEVMRPVLKSPMGGERAMGRSEIGHKVFPPMLVRSLWKAGKERRGEKEFVVMKEKGTESDGEGTEEGNIFKWREGEGV